MKQLKDAKGRFQAYTIDQQYDLYKREYAKAAATLARRNERMFLPELNERQFRARVIAEQNAGRKTGAAFVREFVNASKYETTLDQARAVRKAFKELTGEEFSILSIRRQTAKVVAAWNGIRNEYREMRANGLSAQAAKGIISWVYFGSE